MRGAKAMHVRARIGGEGGYEQTFTGRSAQALMYLVKAGEHGITPITHPAPRTSHYIHCLRRGGLLIETHDEPHGGAFSGFHARYVLKTPISILAVSGATMPPVTHLPSGAALSYGRGA